MLCFYSFTPTFRHMHVQSVSQPLDPYIDVPADVGLHSLHWYDQQLWLHVHKHCSLNIASIDTLESLESNYTSCTSLDLHLGRRHVAAFVRLPYLR